MAFLRTWLGLGLVVPGPVNMNRREDHANGPDYLELELINHATSYQRMFRISAVYWDKDRQLFIKVEQ